VKIIVPLNYELQISPYALSAYHAIPVIDLLACQGIPFLVIRLLSIRIPVDVQTTIAGVLMSRRFESPA